MVHMVNPRNKLQHLPPKHTLLLYRLPHYVSAPGKFPLSHCLMGNAFFQHTHCSEL